MSTSKSLAGEKIAVVGGTGFIGRVLVSQLSAAGAAVTLVTRNRSGNNLNSRLPEISIENSSTEDLKTQFDRSAFDRIFNLAGYGVDPSARDALTMVNVNVELAARLAEAAAAAGRVKAFVHVGSNSEYLDTGSNDPRAEDDLLETRKVYGASKAAGSLVVQSVAATRGLPLIVARLFNVYGPGEASWRLLPSLFKSLKAGQRAALSAGTQLRDFLHVEDVAAGLMELSEAAQDPSAPRVVNLCSGTGISVRSFATNVAQSIGASETLLGFGDLALRPDDVAHLVGSTKRLHAVTSWRPRYTLEQGIKNSLLALETA